MSKQPYAERAHSDDELAVATVGCGGFAIILAILLTVFIIL